MAPKKISSRKSSAVSELSELYKNAKSVAVVDYKGMSVAQATEMRRAVRKAGGEVKVSKNTLFKIAVRSANVQDSMINDQLKGLSAFIFSNNDEISAIKAMADYAKKNGILAFKLGLVGDKVLSAAEILSLANTPPKETSIGKLMYLLNYNTAKLARVIDAIAKKS